ncbi:MAG: hypothetical protein ABW171_04215 [Steroidobacter sp.]
MNGRAVAWAGCLCVALSLIGASRAEESNKQVERPAASAADATKSARKATPAESARQECINQCNVSDGLCNSDVRRARQECSRNAANNGRNPMTLRNDDYTYFCSYFQNPSRRGPGNFQARFTQHYNVCVDLMQQNIAADRYDCYLNERDAQNICRSELRDCQSACP